LCVESYLLPCIKSHILCINRPTESAFSVFYMHDNKTLPTTAILMDRTGNSNGTRLVTLVTDVLKEEYTIRSHDKHKSSPKEKNPKPCIVAYNSNSSSFAPRWIWKEISPYTMYLTCTKSLTSMIPLEINKLDHF